MWRSLRFAMFGVALWVVACGYANAQGPRQLSQIKSIYVAPFEGPNGVQQLHDSLIKRLDKSGDFQLTNDKAQADAVLHGTGALWVRGYQAMNLRSPSTNRVPVYAGYLSVQLSSKDGEPLWSYLATPANLGWKTIVDDLTSTVVKQLIAARASLSAAQTSAATQQAAPTALIGAGATFPQPLYQTWFDTLRATRNIAVTYSGVGSGEGMRLLAEKKVDFAASEADPSADYQLDKVADQYLRIASVLGGVVPVYNLSGLRDDVHFTGELLADIYLGKITRWSDPRIAKVNRGLALPDKPIVVVHRADGSGTTYAWSSFLARSSPEWKMNVGNGLELAWPTGIGADGNLGVATTVLHTPNSIGYVEMVYAIQAQLAYGAVQNHAGEFVRADLETLSVAANSALNAAGAVTGALDPADKHAYPIATFTWLLVPQHMEPGPKKAALTELLRWGLSSGQKACSALGYSPLPKDLAQKQLALVEQWK